MLTGLLLLLPLVIAKEWCASNMHAPDGRISNSKCVFPFRFRGKMTHSCVGNSWNGHGWCALTNNFDRHKLFGACSPCSCSAKLGESCSASSCCTEGSCLNGQCKKQGKLHCPQTCPTSAPCFDGKKCVAGNCFEKKLAACSEVCPAISNGRVSFPEIRVGTTTQGRCLGTTIGKPTRECGENDGPKWKPITGSCTTYLTRKYEDDFATLDSWKSFSRTTQPRKLSLSNSYIQLKTAVRLPILLKSEFSQNTDSEQHYWSLQTEKEKVRVQFKNKKIHILSSTASSSPCTLKDEIYQTQIEYSRNNVRAMVLKNGNVVCSLSHTHNLPSSTALYVVLGAKHQSIFHHVEIRPLYQQCEDFKPEGRRADSEYPMDFITQSGKHVQKNIYCHGMAGPKPLEFLTVVGKNNAFSEISNKKSHIRINFNKVRYQTDQQKIDQTDLTFSNFYDLATKEQSDIMKTIGVFGAHGCSITAKFNVDLSLSGFKFGESIKMKNHGSHVETTIKHDTAHRKHGICGSLTACGGCHLQNSISIIPQDIFQIPVANGPRRKLLQTRRSGTMTLFPARNGLPAFTLTMTVESSQYTLDISGPSDRWFGIGFTNIRNRMELADAIIYTTGKTGTETANVYDYFLSRPHINNVLKDSNQNIQVTSNTVTGNTRRVIVRRPTLNSDGGWDKLIRLSDTTINIIFAYSHANSFQLTSANHGSNNRGFADLALTASGTATTTKQPSKNPSNSPSKRPTNFPTTLAPGSTARPSQNPTKPVSTAVGVCIKTACGQFDCHRQQSPHIVSSSIKAVARCPTGFALTGCGFEDIDALSGAAVDDFMARPLPDNTGCEAAHKAEIDGFYAWAQCCRLDQSLTDFNRKYPIKHKLECKNANRVSDKLQTCDAGWIISGGGFSGVSSNFGTTSDNFESRPLGNTWIVNHGKDTTINSHGICCRVTQINLSERNLPVRTLKCITRTAQGNRATVGTVTCPTGTLPFGGGFSDIDQNGGGNRIDDFGTYPLDKADNAWRTVFADEIDTFTTYATCCSVDIPGGCKYCPATKAPTVSPSKFPTKSPSKTPTNIPTRIPTKVPTNIPTRSPILGIPVSCLQLTCVRQQSLLTNKGQTATATCPSGWILTGGGFEAVDLNGAGTSNDNFQSRPTLNGNGWQVTNNADSNYYYAWAQCCKAEKTATDIAQKATDGHVLECKTVQSKVERNSTKRVADCGSGWMVTGGGFEDVDQAIIGNVNHNFQNHAEGNTWIVNSRLDTDLTGITSFARCCRMKQNLGGAPARGLSCRDSTITGNTKFTQCSAIAKCASDEFALGGGFSDIDQQGTGSKMDKFTSLPSESHCNGWAVAFGDEVNSFNVHARCCKITQPLGCVYPTPRPTLSPTNIPTVPPTPAPTIRCTKGSLTNVYPPWPNSNIIQSSFSTVPATYRRFGYRFTVAPQILGARSNLLLHHAIFKVKLESAMQLRARIWEVPAGWTENTNMNQLSGPILSNQFTASRNDVTVIEYFLTFSPPARLLPNRHYILEFFVNRLPATSLRFSALVAKSKNVNFNVGNMMMNVIPFYQTFNDNRPPRMVNVFHPFIRICLMRELAPTPNPTKQPTESPTNIPSNFPSKSPSKKPTNVPSRSPTNIPTRAPTNVPTQQPTKSPTWLCPVRFVKFPLYPLRQLPQSQIPATFSNHQTNFRRMGLFFNLRDPRYDIWLNSCTWKIRLVRNVALQISVWEVESNYNGNSIRTGTLRARSDRHTMGVSDLVTIDHVVSFTSSQVPRLIIGKNYIIELTMYNLGANGVPTTFTYSAKQSVRNDFTFDTLLFNFKNTHVFTENNINTINSQPPTIRSQFFPELSCCVRQEIHPTPTPTRSPTDRPTSMPSKQPTRRPTPSPTNNPTNLPSKQPTRAPTNRPTNLPSKRPTKAPTNRPTGLPTKRPTNRPTKAPTSNPTNLPTKRPTKVPTDCPRTACGTFDCLRQQSSLKVGAGIIEARCPNSYALTACGFEAVDEDNNVSNDDFSSRPTNDGRGCQANHNNEQDGYYVWAQCCRLEQLISDQAASASLRHELQCVTAQASVKTTGDAISTCPSGYLMTGGGFLDLDHNKFTASDDIKSMPLGSNQWVVSSKADTDGVQSYAQCCRVTALQSGFPTREISCRTLELTGTKTATITCGAGYFPFGGGFGDIDHNGGGTRFDEFGSYPLDKADRSWRVIFNDDRDTFKGYARCCIVSSPGGCKYCPGTTTSARPTTSPTKKPTNRPTSAPIRPVACGTFDCNRQQSVYTTGGKLARATCPDTYQLTGCGFENVDEDGNVSNDDFTSKPSADGRSCEGQHKTATGGIYIWAQCCRLEMTVNDDTNRALLEHKLDCVSAPASVKTTGTATSTCPVGYIVAGGGFEDIDQNVFRNANDNLQSKPQNNNQWIVSSGADNDGVSSYARCCRIVRRSNNLPDPKRQLQCTMLTAQNSGSVATARCGNLFPFGGGFGDIDHNGGGTTQDDFGSYPLDKHDRSWRVVFSDDVNSFSVHARCCTVNIPGGCSYAVTSRPTQTTQTTPNPTHQPTKRPVAGQTTSATTTTTTTTTRTTRATTTTTQNSNSACRDNSDSTAICVIATGANKALYCAESLWRTNCRKTCNIC